MSDMVTRDELIRLGYTSGEAFRVAELGGLILHAETLPSQQKELLYEIIRILTRSGGGDQRAAPRDGVVVRIKPEAGLLFTGALAQVLYEYRNLSRETGLTADFLRGVLATMPDGEDRKNLNILLRDLVDGHDLEVVKA